MYHREKLVNKYRESKMKRSGILFAVLLLSIIIAITAWSKEIFQIEQHNGMVLLLDVDQSADAEMEIPLHAAVKENDLVEVKRLINEGADINCNYHGMNPLCKAVLRKNNEMAVLLIENGADVNSPNLILSALELAANKNDIEMIKLLIDNGATVCGPDESPLLDPARKGYIEAIDLLVANGADVNVVGSEGITPIFEAIYDRNIETMKILIKHNADVNYQSEEGLGSPLHYAISYNFVKGVELLLEHGAETELKTKNDGATPLHMAVADGRKEIIEMLLQHGADINALNKRNQTALNIATYIENIVLYRIQAGIDTEEITTEEITEGLKVVREIIELLIGHGARINLHDAVLLEDMNCVKDLLDKGVDVNAQDCIQMTALHHAVNNDQLQMIELLLQESADINIVDGQNWTAIHYASFGGNDEILKLLLSQDNIDLTIKAQNGMTALDMAIDKNHNELVKLLENYRFDK
ncbi:hypothetical protein DRH14_03425 [Candidatus Shapirobacteria bacterium]|nr:MAG: hypothetical protein DRH14_03425 [Candidatus Shapirobacteria bacterium]